MPKYQVKSSDSGGVSQNQTGTPSKIWNKSIPEGVTVSTNFGAVSEPLFRVYTLDVFDGTGSKTTFSLTNDVIENPRMASAGGDVVAYVDGSQTTNFSVDYANDEVTFNSAPSSGTDNVEIFYIFEPGLLEVIVENNDQGNATEELLTEALRSLHRVDQIDNPVEIDQAHLEKPNNLAVTLDSSVQVTTDDRAPHKIRIPFVKNEASEERVEQYQNNLGSGA